MGGFDSSKTRVKPIFDTLQSLDGTGMSWLPTLLRLPQREPPSPVPRVVGRLEEARWTPTEKALPAPPSLLRWLVSNPEALARAPGARSDSGETRVLRAALLRGDVAARDAALRLLEQGQTSQAAWYIFEGPTYPDVFVQTEDAIVVIEGKRTESDITRRTTWMPVRHQMLRHLDCAWEVRGGRTVYGCVIVEGNGGGTVVAVPEHWRRVCAETVTLEALNGSLPHRSAEERRAIAEGYLGVTTWQAVCRTFDIAWERLANHS